jgi:hypothetical protein
MEWQPDGHQGCEFVGDENLVEIASVEASQRGGTVDAEEGGKEGLRSHEERTKLWVNPFSGLLRHKDSRNGCEQLRRIQRFLQKGRRPLAEAFGLDVGAALRSQYDDRQCGENFMDGVKHGDARDKRHPQIGDDEINSIFPPSQDFHRICGAIGAGHDRPFAGQYLVECAQHSGVVINNQNRLVAKFFHHSFLGYWFSRALAAVFSSAALSTGFSMKLRIFPSAAKKW